MQLFSRDGHGSARFQVFDSASDFLIPSLLHGFTRSLQAIEQDVGQRGSFLNGKGKRPC
jgi:hypothetical protein